MEQYIRDFVGNLAEKASKQDEINIIVRDKLAELDKKLEVHLVKSESAIVQLTNDLRVHGKNCPINKNEVKTIAIEAIQSKEAERIIAEKAKEEKPKEDRIDSNTSGLFSIWKSSHPIERFIILLIALYFIFDKIGLFDKIFSTQ